MHTGVANKAAMLWRLFVQDAESRTVFPGVSHLYRALHAGAAGDEAQPDALRLARALGHLRASSRRSSSATTSRSGRSCSCASGGSAGGTRCRAAPSTTSGVLIEAMMALYADMPFVLIGDSGQHDPEVYRRIVDEARRRGCGRSTSATSPRAGRSAPPRSRRWPRRCARPAAHLVLARDSLAIAEDAAASG